VHKTEMEITWTMFVRRRS